MNDAKFLDDSLKDKRNSRAARGVDHAAMNPRREWKRDQTASCPLKHNQGMPKALHNVHPLTIATANAVTHAMNTIEKIEVRRSYRAYVRNRRMTETRDIGVSQYS